MNILIIKLGALGDVVMSTPLVEAIVAAHPKDKVFLLTSPPFEAIYSNFENLHIQAFPRRGLRNMFAAVRWIRSLRCTRIYDLQGSDRSAVLCALAGSAQRVGNRTHYPYTHHPENRWHGQTHIFDRLVLVLASAAVSDVSDLAYLPATNTERAKVSDWLSANNVVEQNFAILHAGASPSRPEKCWPHFQTLAKRLRDQHICPVWIGANDDQRINERLARTAGGCDATNCFSVVELAELGRRARFAVTNDSGPMHVLSASQIPVFGIFGPSDWRRNHALGQADNVIAGVQCIPAYRGANTADCLSDLPCEIVWQRLTDAKLIF